MAAHAKANRQRQFPCGEGTRRRIHPMKTLEMQTLFSLFRNAKVIEFIGEAITTKYLGGQFGVEQAQIGCPYAKEPA